MLCQKYFHFSYFLPPKRLSLFEKSTIASTISAVEISGNNLSIKYNSVWAPLSQPMSDILFSPDVRIIKSAEGIMPPPSLKLHKSFHDVGIFAASFLAL